MEVNWFTFTAQIINFLILLWLLKHFLYTPLLNVMKNREDAVLNRLEEARQILADAEEKATLYQEKMDELKEKRHEWLEEAKQESESARKEFLHAARAEADAIREKWIQSVESDKKMFFSTLEERAIKKILGIVERILKDLSDSDLEKRTIERFLDKLCDKKNESSIRAEAVGRGDEIEIVSSFPIHAEDRQRIDQKIQRIVPEDCKTIYRTDSELGFGIELRTDGWKLGWNVQSYLKDMRSEVDKLINQSLHTGMAR